MNNYESLISAIFVMAKAESTNNGEYLSKVCEAQRHFAGKVLALVNAIKDKQDAKPKQPEQPTLFTKPRRGGYPPIRVASTRNGRIVAKYDSISAAERATSLCHKQIRTAIDTGCPMGGYYWQTW